MPFKGWLVQEYDAQLAKSLSHSLNLSPLISRLLVQRGVTDHDTARRFLHPGIEQLHDPFQLPDFPKSIDRLITAVQKKEHIVIHGDYDADGVTSTAMVNRLLELLGANVSYYIPNRFSDGYGLSSASVGVLHDTGAKVIVSVDCGIRSIEAANRADQLGIDLIVTDHHEPLITSQGHQLPNAFSVINPRLVDSSYPEKNLSGAGVAFKLVQGLCQRTGHDAWLPAFAKLAAIGTVADVVPLQGENRIIVRLGLDQLSSGPNSVGLDALVEVAGLAGKSIDSENLAFRIIPRLNAAGRMGSADLAARLLLANDPSRENEANGLARELDELNTQRQLEQRNVFAKARKRIDADSDIGSHRVIVIGEEGWHRGVIGIVASKLVETYEKPSIVLSIEGEVAYGSARNTPNFDLLGALNQCADLLTQFGGHRMAAGVTLPAANVSTLQLRMNEYAEMAKGEEEDKFQLEIDAPLELKELNGEVVAEINQLKPFGRGNPEPVFQASGVKMMEGPTVLKNQHLAMMLNQEGHVFRAIAWRSAHRRKFLLGLRDKIDVAYSLMENHFRGESTIQLSIADVREAR
mgnify:CR=1 FL=1